MSASHLQLLSEPAPRTKPVEWLALVRMEVDLHLHEFFEEKKKEMTTICTPTLELIDQIEALTMRGGKRLRPALATAGYRCVRPGEGLDRLLDLCASLELMQSYLLIHDDWMDGDEVRRGGAAVHASLRESHGNAHLGCALGVLAGDLAGTYAWELFLRAPYPMRAWAAASAAFLSIHKEVYGGQQLDLIGSPDVTRMHQLKTTSYSVRGPLVLGALMGDASDGQLDALSQWAAPMGQAFQIRDDLLGALGSEDSTGKPGMDIPHGKMTSVLAELRASTEPTDREPVESIVGRDDVSHRELMRARGFLHESGVVERLERRIAALRSDAIGVLDHASFNPLGRSMLLELTEKLTMRVS